MSIANQALAKAIGCFSSAADFCRALGVKKTAVYGYDRRGIPAERVLDIERITNQQVKRYELRPDLYPPEDYRRQCCLFCEQCTADQVRAEHK